MAFVRKNQNVGLDTIHRKVLGRLDKMHSNTILCVKKFKHGKDSWAKYLIVKNTGEKVMLITALYTFN